ncbi:uncharacterized protein At4g14450, chloroplastic-like [Typha latifolia]|uniref:uncharacterized protein At4g14450, chloroplastic-like n=1 Tax=Typha latifolia TaxID=4733 RepID=UPI003C2BD7CA
MDGLDATTPVTGRGKLRRQRSRLQMRAPSSIQVSPAEPAAVAEWRSAIPLLSPLDISAVPRVNRTAEREEEVAAPPCRGNAVAVGATWQHPAAPFHYEPVPGNAPAFAFPHYA